MEATTTKKVNALQMSNATFKAQIGTVNGLLKAMYNMDTMPQILSDLINTIDPVSGFVKLVDLKKYLFDNDLFVVKYRKDGTCSAYAVLCAINKVLKSLK